jgi:hypothetical protein
MKRILVKRFTLQHSGKRYCAGSVVNMDDAEAEALAKSEPRCFELLDYVPEETAADAAPPDNTAHTEGADAEDGLPAADPAKNVRV